MSKSLKLKSGSISVQLGFCLSLLNRCSRPPKMISLVFALIMFLLPQFNTLNNALARCPHCRKISSVGDFSKKRGLVFCAAAVLTFIVALALTVGLYSSAGFKLTFLFIGKKELSTTDSHKLRRSDFCSGARILPARLTLPSLTANFYILNQRQLLF